MNVSHWISDRSKAVEISGIRKVFELARSLKDPVNLSIGQPHFDVPEPIKAAAKAAIDSGLNGYTVTQGIPELREKLLADALQKLEEAGLVTVSEGRYHALPIVEAQLRLEKLWERYAKEGV